METFKKIQQALEMFPVSVKNIELTINAFDFEKMQKEREGINISSGQPLTDAKVLSEEDSMSFNINGIYLKVINNKQFV